RAHTDHARVRLAGIDHRTAPAEPGEAVEHHGNHGDHSHEAHAHGHGHPGHDHGGHGGHDHGDHAAMFRRLFWWSLLLSLPVVITSPMIMDWFGYELDFPGIDWVGPVLGSVVFWWAGWPFLSGGWHEARTREPGMMLLIAM